MRGSGIPLGSPGDGATFRNVGAFGSAIIYFVVFMGIVYFAIVVPYR
jgi:large conductance mechanosensitive channel